MEILSTGEKIKRSRVYRGITLKELCQDKISISKMSCIENGKVKADKTILQYIADKIGVEYNYLVKDVYDQISENIELIKKMDAKGDDIEDTVKINLSYAVEYKYYTLAFEIIHILINNYLKNKKIEKLQLYISKYYDLYQKDISEKNTIDYYIDMASFLVLSEEYGEAIIYYDKLKKLVDLNSISEDRIAFFEVCYKESFCYSNMKQYKKAFVSLEKIINEVNNLKDDNLKKNIYELFSMLAIKNESKQAKEYIDKVIDLKKDDDCELALLKVQYGEAFFEVANESQAVREIKEAVSLYTSNSKEEYVYFLSKCIKILYKNKKYEDAYEITDDALNSAIIVNDLKLIERIYYYKGSILQKQKKYKESEKYMNLSLDSLFKCGNKEERYARYLEMGNLYYHLDDVKESIKYFTLANKIKNNRQ